jgi:hypothetical protein
LRGGYPRRVSNRALEPVRLPKDWPKHVRAAILQVIALAQFAVLHTRAFAANSIWPRVRLTSELDEAKAQIALLLAELRSSQLSGRRPI